ncbi:hypothetical protein IMZ48_27855 [Candidatus Bathyarchaeota archaeon]|nr:hypothetical protein [Candidatus Bathyarchaeota archaeon]
MKTAILATALAATALAQNAAHLARRREETLPGETSDECLAAVEVFNSAAPPAPTAWDPARESYYQTASFTATGTDADCAWVTTLPESAYSDYKEYSEESLEWMAGEEAAGLVAEMEGACLVDDVRLADDMCVEEWDVVKQKAAGGDKGGDKEEDESAAAGVRVYVAGALLAAGIALL